MQAAVSAAPEGVTFRGGSLPALLRTAPGAQVTTDERRALESARELKYAEIRDNETDYRTGKLSEEDYRALDRLLRSEAVDILRAIDELEARADTASG